MTRILCIESSGPVCSLAYFYGEACVVKEENGSYSHAEKMAVMAAELIKEMGKPDAIAISKGPGSYTGLRIGVSLAKGLCFGYSIPLVAIPTLEAMASGYMETHPANERLLCPMIDARRMEVYTSVYSASLQELLPVRAEVLTEKSLEEYRAKGIVFFGDGAAKCREIFPAGKDILIEDGFFPSAKFLGIPAKRKFENGNFEDTAYFEPFYLKEFFVTPAKNKLL